jgi:S-formylglutathione hydrolase FrmB
MRKRLVVILLVACGSPPPAELRPSRGPIGSAAVEARRAPPAPKAAEPGIEGEITVKDGATPRGRLVVGWRTPDEQRELDAGRFSLALARAMIERYAAADEIDFATTKSAHYRVVGSPKDAVPTVLLDVDHTFWPTLFGHGHGYFGTGKSGGGDIVIAANANAPEVDACVGPRMRRVTIDEHHFCAWLPPSWEERGTKKYPMILMLPGLMSGEVSYLRGARHLGERFDAIAKETKKDALLVGVDTATKLGSTYLEDSVGHGQWNTFLAKQALPVLEHDLHAISSRTARALVGHSTGGYNALSYGMRHSDLFSVIGSSSPDAPDVEAWLFPPGSRRANEWVRKWFVLEDALGGAGQGASWAADWSPDPSAPHGFRWPIDLTTGDANEQVLAKWVAHTPHGLVRDAAFLARVKKDLTGRIYITCGKSDEFELFGPAEKMAKELESLGVVTRFEPTDGGHGNHHAQLEAALRFVVERLDPNAKEPARASCAPQKCVATGQCDAHFDGWSWDGKTCVQFSSGGCGVSCNLHASKVDCIGAYAHCGAR